LGEGENVIECEYNGEEKEIILNYHFLYDPLQAMDSDDIVLGFNDVEKLLVLKEKNNDNYINIIVPIVRGKNA
jgi:DNA polymerase-3 subunit beta